MCLDIAWSVMSNGSARAAKARSSRSFASFLAGHYVQPLAAALVAATCASTIRLTFLCLVPQIAAAPR